MVLSASDTIVTILNVFLTVTELALPYLWYRDLAFVAGRPTTLYFRGSVLMFM
jgi:hypothetical protein